MSLTKITALLALLLVLLAIVAVEITSVINQPNQLTNALDVELKRGATVRTLARQLHDAGVLKHPKYLEVWARINTKAHRLQAGEYQLQEHFRFVTSSR